LKSLVPKMYKTIDLVPNIITDDSPLPVVTHVVQSWGKKALNPKPED